jgi:hypothetical protein
LTQKQSENKDKKKNTLAENTKTQKTSTKQIKRIKNKEHEEYQA